MRSAALAVAALALVPFVGAARADPQPQVRIVYGDVAGANAATSHARDVLAKSHALEELQRFLTPLRLPTDLTFRAEECGAERRAYDADTKTATICYEMIADILNIAAAQTGVSDQDRSSAIVGTIVEALFHETAFALFDLYDVPVWGRIEDAADRFSALVMMQFGENAAQTTILGTARFFDWSARTWTGSDFASATAPEAQRFYNFLCIAYGGDPITFYNLKTSGVLPEYRANYCAYE